MNTDDNPSVGEDVGVIGNERLTALAGLVLLGLAVVETATVLALSSLLAAHFFVGMLMLGPVAVKGASTGYRFVRYYTRSEPYRRKGPPRLLLRVLSPVLLVSTLVVIGTGIGLAITGPYPAPLVALHKVSFLVWIVTLTVHIIAYLARSSRSVAADWVPTVSTQRMPGRWTRGVVVLLGTALGVGAGLVVPGLGPWAAWFRRGGDIGMGPAVLIVFVSAGVVLAVVRRAWSS